MKVEMILLMSHHGLMPQLSSLKKLSIQGHFSGSSLVIDAPRLGFLNIKANLFERFTITNTDTNVKLVIDPVLSFWDFDEANLYSNINRFCSFLSSISKVIRHMMLSGDTFKERDADFHQKQHLQYMDEIDISYVPECLLSSLEFVDFNVTLSRLVGEMNLARYILENSAILKKLTLRLHKNDCSAKKYDLVKKLLKIPRGSAKCEVVFDWNREQVRLCDEFAPCAVVSHLCVFSTEGFVESK
ncbi:unnamed protein product [Brassica oleracea]|uniref:(rape) hypothetical protein n=1 Tax=Brassica napus TaxID=3708 RepID=A0A816I8Y6_BRANA|nr:unnamed protein product [Brassica napus]